MNLTVSWATRWRTVASASTGFHFLGDFQQLEKRWQTFKGCQHEVHQRHEVGEVSLLQSISSPEIMLAVYLQDILSCCNRCHNILVIIQDAQVFLLEGHHAVSHRLSKWIHECASVWHVFSVNVPWWHKIESVCSTPHAGPQEAPDCTGRIFFWQCRNFYKFYLVQRLLLLSLSLSLSLSLTITVCFCVCLAGTALLSLCLPETLNAFTKLIVLPVVQKVTFFSVLKSQCTLSSLLQPALHVCGYLSASYRPGLPSVYLLFFHLSTRLSQLGSIFGWLTSSLLLWPQTSCLPEARSSAL